MTRWTETDLEVIAQAAGDAEHGLKRLTEHFEPQGIGKLIEACGAADKLLAGRALEASNQGAMLTRDFGPIAHVITSVQW